MISTTMVQFSASIPYFTKKLLNYEVGASIQLVNISLYFEINSFIRTEIGLFIGAGVQGGVYFDFSRWKIEIYGVVGLFVGALAKTTIDINAALMPVY